MLETLLNEGWTYHDSQSERLAGELEAAAEAPVEAGLLDEFLHLSNNTIGEHLGDWARARRLAEAVLGGLTPTAQTARAWSRLSVARLLAGDGALAVAADLAAAATSGDPLATIIEARFLLVAALVGSKRAPEAAAIYQGALDLARQVGDGAPARAIAVASNNLGFELVEAASRTAEEDALMEAAAEAGYTYWLRCGTWVNEEKALYLRALVAVALGRPHEALEHAEAGLAIIAANDPQPIDAALLHLTRSAARKALGDGDGAATELAAADAAAAWADAAARAWYQAERAKVA